MLFTVDNSLQMKLYFKEIKAGYFFHFPRKSFVSLIVPVLIIVLFFLSGCRFNKDDSEPWEGITGNILKINISEFFPFEENIDNAAMKKMISERINQRASLIIASYISMNLPKNQASPDNDAVFNKMMDSIISSGILSEYECYENNYCTAHIEYDISELQKKLEQLNNR